MILPCLFSRATLSSKWRTRHNWLYRPSISSRSRAGPLPFVTCLVRVFVADFTVKDGAPSAWSDLARYCTRLQIDSIGELGGPQSTEPTIVDHVCRQAV